MIPQPPFAAESLVSFLLPFVRAANPELPCRDTEDGQPDQSSNASDKVGDHVLNCGPVRINSG